MPTVTVRHENSRLLRIRRLLGLYDHEKAPEVDAAIAEELKQPTVSLDRIRHRLQMERSRHAV
jgi:hypothetical protein